MSENLRMTKDEGVAEALDLERKHGAIRTALFLLAFSQLMPITHYLWQVYCC
jgi:hypothetical protein